MSNNVESVQQTTTAYQQQQQIHHNSHLSVNDAGWSNYARRIKLCNINKNSSDKTQYTHYAELLTHKRHNDFILTLVHRRDASEMVDQQHRKVTNK